MADVVGMARYGERRGVVHITAAMFESAAQFEMRLPEVWNGRFLHQVNGGNDGEIVPAIGVPGEANAVDGKPGLAQGPLNAGRQPAVVLDQQNPHALQYPYGA